MYPDYRDPFWCPYHGCATESGWCWECAVETYGYDKAKLVHDGKITIEEGKEKA